MRKFILLFILIITSLFSSELNFTEEEKHFIKNSPKIKIGSINSYTPFSFMKNGNKVGFTQDLIAILAEKSGLKFEKVGGLWPEVYGLFLDEKIDVLTELSYRKSREAFTSFSEPYYEIPIGVFTRKEFGNYSSLNDFKNKKIGVIKNSYIIEIFKKEDVNLVEFNDSDERFRALNNGKIDAVISSALNKYKVESLMLSNIKLAGIFIHPHIEKEDLRFGVRKENPLLSSIINKTLDSIPFSVISQLKEKWIFNLHISKSYTKLTDKERDWIAKNRVSIGIEQAKPYMFFDHDKDINSGLYFDILKKVIKNTGLDVNYIYSPWTTLLEDFKKDRVDLLPATFYSKDREKIGHFSKEYYKVREYIYISDKNKYIKNFIDLKNKKIAITKDYATIQKIKNKFPEINIVETEGLHESVTKVLNGELDALVDYHLVVENYIRDNSVVGLKDIAQNDLMSTSVHFLSNIKKPILKSILDKGLSDISREEMNGILKNWVKNPYNHKNEEELLSKKELEFIKNHKKIRFGIRTNRPPFAFFENGKAKGIAVEYVKKSANNVGLEVEFVYVEMSVMDSYRMTETREKFDTLLFTINNEKNKKRFSMGEAYLSYPMMIIKHKDSPYIGSLKNLLNKTVVLEKAFGTNKWIKRDYPSIKIVNVANTLDALRYINEGKADAYVGNLAISNYFSVFGGLDNLKVAGPSGYGNINYHFIAPKEWPELSSILSKGFKQISSVDHSAIQQRWFSLQTIDKIDYLLVWKVLLVSVLIIIWILWWTRKITIEKDKTSKALEALEKAKDALETKNIEVLESKRFLESVINGIQDLIFLKDKDFRYIACNNAFLKFVGKSRSEMIGYDDYELFDKEIASLFRSMDIEMLDKNEENFNTEWVTYPNGEKYYLQTLKSPFNYKEDFIGILGISRDITEFDKLQKEEIEQERLLFQQSKMASMGDMIGNIAHQWRQPLSVISTSASGIQLKKEFGTLDDEFLDDTLNLIGKNAQYLSTTIDTFRNFIKEKKEFKKVILQDRIKVALKIVDTTLRNNYIELRNEIYKTELIEIDLIVGELTQVIINIINNSKDAIKEKNIKNAWVKIKLDKLEENVYLIIEDNGGGIPEEVLPHIFEPYFTTKQESNGTGLGLHMSYKIITESLHGKLSAENTREGARFIIELPK